MTWQWLETYRPEAWWRWRVRLAWRRHQEAHWLWCVAVARDAGDGDLETWAWDRFEAAEHRRVLVEFAAP